MMTFTVSVHVGGTCHRYKAIAACSVDAICAAIDTFGVCSVTAKPCEVRP